ncbi:MAG: hypothetical protein IPJ24_09815 [bacterium]|nr:hypothetical protein [bacterium]
MHPSRSAIVVLLPALVLAALLAGCSAESDPAPPAVPPVGPVTPDRLVQDFQTVYETMSAEEHARLLDAAFIMPLQSRAMATFPDLGPAIELAEALRIHERLFSQQDVVDPDQQAVEAVQAIAFQTFERRGDWAEAIQGSAYPGTVNALFDVIMLFDRGGLPSMLKVQGTLQFHVARRDTVVNGVSGTYCRLRAISDLTDDTKLAAGSADNSGADKSVETVSLSRLLGLWR